MSYTMSYDTGGHQMSYTMSYDIDAVCVGSILLIYLLHFWCLRFCFRYRIWVVLFGVVCCWLLSLCYCLLPLAAACCRLLPLAAVCRCLLAVPLHRFAMLGHFSEIREISVPYWAGLGRSCAGPGRSWAASGRSWAKGPKGPTRDPPLPRGRSLCLQNLENLRF